jgi:hypothetical protein
MGFLSRLFIPRKVRRVLHPVRSAKRAVRKAVVPKSVRRATYAAKQIANPVSADLLRRAATELVAAGLSYRDAGIALGISHQRIDQLVGDREAS